MYRWPYEDGKEMTQLEANSMPCEHFEGNCKAPYCSRWKSLSRTYFIKGEDGLTKAELIELLDQDNLGWCV